MSRSAAIAALLLACAACGSARAESLAVTPVVDTPAPPTAPPSPTAPPATPRPAPAGLAGEWQLVFGDEFDGEQLDPAQWTTCYWWGVRGCTIATNHELQWYQPENVQVRDGLLRLRARRASVTGSDGKHYAFTSGMVSTGRDSSDRSPPARFAFQYGLAEIRARVPAGVGLWPAFWMLPDDHASRPEIDVLEILGDAPDTIHMALHFLDGQGERARAKQAWSGPDFSRGWHTFAVDWRPESLAWYVDGVERWRYTAVDHIPAQPMYLLVNLAVGGDWPGAPDETTPFPSYFEIDYVRVWQRSEAP